MPAPSSPSIESPRAASNSRETEGQTKGSPEDVIEPAEAPQQASREENLSRIPPEHGNREGEQSAEVDAGDQQDNGDQRSPEKNSNTAEDLIEIGSEILQSAQTLDQGSDPTLQTSPDSIESGESTENYGLEDDPFLPELIDPTIANTEVFFEKNDRYPDESTLPNQQPNPPEKESGEAGSATQQTADNLGTSSPPSELSSDDGQEVTTSQRDLDENSNLPMTLVSQAVFEAGQALVLAGEALNEESLGSVDAKAVRTQTTQTSISQAQIAIILAKASLDELDSGNLHPAEYQTKTQVDNLLNRAEELLARAALQNSRTPSGGTEESKQNLGQILIVDDQGLANQRISELEDELNASIAVFENEMQAARDAAASVLSGRTIVPVWEASSEDLEAVSNATMANESANSADSMEVLSDGQEQHKSEPSQSAQGKDLVTGRTPDGRRFESPPPPEDLEVPEDIPSPQGDDIVAKQLREAAMAEQDPELREKLWEEYKRYKAGL